MAIMIIPGGYLAEDSKINSVNAERDALNFRVGVTDRWRDARSGEQKEHTEWTECVIYGAKGTLQATAEKLLTKGQLIYAQGVKRTRVQRDESGKYIGENTQLVIDRGTLKPLGAKPSNSAQPQQAPQQQQQTPQQQTPQQQAPQQPQQAPQQQAPQDDFDDDIPFA